MTLGKRGEAYFTRKVCDECTCMSDIHDSDTTHVSQKSHRSRVLSAHNLTEIDSTSQKTTANMSVLVESQGNNINLENNQMSCFSDDDIAYNEVGSQEKALMASSEEVKNADYVQWSWGELPSLHEKRVILKPRKTKHSEQTTKCDRLANIYEIKTSCKDKPIRASLCRNRLNPKLSEFETEQIFLENEVVVAEILQNDSILKDDNLIVKIGSELLKWSEAAGKILALSMVTAKDETNKTKISPDKKKVLKSVLRSNKYHRAVAHNHHPNCSKYSFVKNKSKSQHQENVECSWNSWSRQYEMYCSCLSDDEGDATVEKRRQSDCISSELDTINLSTNSNLCKKHHDANNEQYEKTIRLPHEELIKLNLNYGRNEISFSICTKYQGMQEKTANIFLWNFKEKLVISDIDGTITRSDLIGNILPYCGRDWTQLGIVNCYKKIAENGYKFVYLSSRALGQSGYTRSFISSIKQDNLKMPEGPILISPSSLVKAFNAEVIRRVPEKFKSQCLRDVGSLFYKEGKNDRPLYAGFGNRSNDFIAYTASGIPPSRIFIVNYKGRLVRQDAPLFDSSYDHMAAELVDIIFPPLKRNQFDENVDQQDGGDDDNFHTHSYWKSAHSNIDKFLLSKLN